MVQSDLSELFRELLDRIQYWGKFDFLPLVLHDPVDDVMRVNALHVLVPVTVPVSLQLPVSECFDGWGMAEPETCRDRRCRC